MLDLRCIHKLSYAQKDAQIYPNHKHIPLWSYIKRCRCIRTWDENMQTLDNAYTHTYKVIFNLFEFLRMLQHREYCFDQARSICVVHKCYVPYIGVVLPSWGFQSMKSNHGAIIDSTKRTKLLRFGAICCNFERSIFGITISTLN